MTEKQILLLIQRRADTCRKIADEYFAESRGDIPIDKYRTTWALAEKFSANEHLLRDVIAQIKENFNADNG